MIFQMINFVKNAAVKSVKQYKCPDCGLKFSEDVLLYRHVSAAHKDDIPEGFTPKQYCFGRRRDKWFQVCIMCKVNHTEWNEKAGRYNQVCEDETCKQRERQRFLDNYKKRNGKDHTIDDPEKQKEMLANRKTSGVYKFPDGEIKHYASQREKEFLEHWDKDLELPSPTIEECSIYFKYKYEGKNHTYIPDFYSAPYNLIIEIKSGENKHPKYLAYDRETEKLKDEAVKKSKAYNYIKIIDSDFEDLDQLLQILKARPINEKLKEDDVFIVIPKYKNPTGDFKMPKLKFMENEDHFYYPLMQYIWAKVCKNPRLKLVLDTDFIPEVNQDREILTESQIILRESDFNPGDKGRVKQIMKEFTLYYTKQYEQYINQDFLSVYFELPSHFIAMDIDGDLRDVDIPLKWLSEHHTYLTMKTKRGYTIIFNVMRDVMPKDMFDKKIRIRNSGAFVPVPGTLQGNTPVEIDENRTTFITPDRLEKLLSDEVYI